jgi:ABC-type multidrug transport system ATPase subunit
MKILLNTIGKRYNKQFVFKNLDYTIEQGTCIALLGNNGSGKSTLLQCIMGYIQLTKGSITYELNEQKIPDNEIFKQLSYASPFLELIEEFTLTEMVQFHAKFKPLYNNITIEKLAQTVGLTDAINKPIVQYSSGMKQRLKLALAFFSQSNVLCLDEPLSNLDINGYEVYHYLVQHHMYNRTVIVSSNDKQEYEFCTQFIYLNDLKL